MRVAPSISACMRGSYFLLGGGLRVPVRGLRRRLGVGGSVTVRHSRRQGDEPDECYRRREAPEVSTRAFSPVVAGFSVGRVAILTVKD